MLHNLTGPPEAPAEALRDSCGAQSREHVSLVSASQRRSHARPLAPRTFFSLGHQRHAIWPLPFFLWLLFLLLCGLLSLRTKGSRPLASVWVFLSLRIAALLTSVTVSLPQTLCFTWRVRIPDYSNFHLLNYKQ